MILRLVCIWLVFIHCCNFILCVTFITERQNLYCKTTNLFLYHFLSLTRIYTKSKDMLNGIFGTNVVNNVTVCNKAQSSRAVVTNKMNSPPNRVMRRLTTGIRSEKCVVRLFRLYAHVTECTYINLDSIV
jgi:hypothetical protein